MHETAPHSEEVEGPVELCLDASDGQPRRVARGEEGCTYRRLLVSKEEGCRLDSNPAVVSFVLVRVDGVVGEGPEDAGEVQRDAGGGKQRREA